jgi:hypothetical protein
LGNIYSKNKPLRTYTFGQVKRCLPTTAADIDNSFSRLYGRALEGYEAEWMNLGIKLLLPPHPFGAALFVPVANLLLVSCRFHVMLLLSLLRAKTYVDAISVSHRR